MGRVPLQRAEVVEAAVILVAQVLCLRRVQRQAQAN